MSDSGDTNIELNGNIQLFEEKEKNKSLSNDNLNKKNLDEKMEFGNRANSLNQNTIDEPVGKTIVLLIFNMINFFYKGVLIFIQIKNSIQKYFFLI